MTQAPLDRLLRSSLKLRHLQLLLALEQHRHLGRAAASLALTQPAVSKTLAEVERLFGQPLFTRSTRGTEPTEAGQVVLRFARVVLAEADRTAADLAAGAAGASGRVRVGAMVVALPGLLARAVVALKAATPHCTVLVEEGDLQRLLPLLRAGELDLIVGRLEPGHAAPDLLTEPLRDEPMVVVAAPGHPLLRPGAGTRLGWAELSRWPWMMPPPWASSRVKLQQQFYRHGVNPPADLVESAGYLATLSVVRSRGALALWARGVADEAAAQGLVQVLPLAVPLPLPPVGLISLRARPPSPVTTRLMQALREAVRPPARRRGRGGPRSTAAVSPPA